MAHDMSKWMKGKEYLRYAQEAGIQPDAYQLANPGLLHAQVSAHLLQTLFGEQDEDVLQAIRLHMGGAPNMRKLDACVCLADWIEPGRDFPDVPELQQAGRALAGAGLAAALPPPSSCFCKRAAWFSPTAWIPITPLPKC